MSSLPAGYEIRVVSDEEFMPLWKAHAPSIFQDNSQIFWPMDKMTEDEKTRAKELNSIYGREQYFNLGLFYKGEFAGWCAGEQEPRSSYYMRNSAILPAHRRKGLYTALLNRTLEELVPLGYQKFWSRHSVTNNAVIIPKLKFGFQIAAMEVSDVFGVLVHLVYFPKEFRRKMMVYRAGDMKPDQEIRDVLKI